MHFSWLYVVHFGYSTLLVPFSIDHINANNAITRLGTLFLGSHRRDLAFEQPRLRHRSRCLVQLDVQFYRVPGYPSHA